MNYRGLVARTRKQDRKLVAAETCDKITGANALLEPFCDVDKQLVAADMAETVVDDLEPVKVEKQNRELCEGVILCVGYRLPESIHERQPIGQFRQRIVKSFVSELFLGYHAVSDVPERVYSPDVPSAHELRL